jgi:hypothetical protein
MALALVVWVSTDVLRLMGAVILAFAEWLHYQGTSGAGALVWLLFLIPSLAQLVVAAFLWTRAPWIAQQMATGQSRNGPLLRVRGADLMTVAFSVIGVITSLMGLYGFVLSYVRFRIAEMNVDFWLSSDVLWGSLLQIGLGIWLTLGSRGLMRVIRRLRSGDVDHSPELRPDDDPSAA